MFFKPKKVNEICYKTFVRPHIGTMIEYSAKVWDLHQQTGSCPAESSKIRDLSILYFEGLSVRISIK